MSFVFVHVVVEELARQLLKQLRHHHIVLGANSDKRQLELVRQLLRLGHGHLRVVNQVYFRLHQDRGQRTALVLHLRLPALNVLEALPVRGGEGQHAGGRALVVPPREGVVLLLAGRVPKVEVYLLADLLDEVLLLEEVHAKRLLVLLLEDVLHKTCQQTRLPHLEW